MVIGLTGGVGSGKSTALKVFKKLGCRTLSADDIAHGLLENDRSIRKRITDVFGERILGRGDSISRKKLGKLVFSDLRYRKKLDAIMLPVISEKLKNIVSKEKKKKGILVAEVPLLFEAKLEHIFDKTIVVYVPKRIGIKRLMKRGGLTGKEARRMIESQMFLDKKKKIADFVIRNDFPGGISKQAKGLYNTFSGLKEAV